MIREPSPTYSYTGMDAASVHACLARRAQYCDDAPDPVPYERPETPVCGVSEKKRTRDGVRFFTNRVVEPELIEIAVAIAKVAPSACNRQPFHLHLLTDRRDINLVGGLAPGTAGSLDIIPLLGVLVGHASAFRFTRDRHLIYIDGWLFLGHLLPTLTALDLGTCVLNWTPDWNNDRKAVDYLVMDMSKTIVCLLAIGYRDDTAAPIFGKKTNANLLRRGT